MAGLFSEYILRGKKIKNRIVMPPMVCFGWPVSEGMATEEHVNHYERRAAGGTGLIIVEALCVSGTGRIMSNQLGLWKDSQISGLAGITAVCHDHGSIVMAQIHHAGRKSSRKVTKDPIAPSEYVKDGKRAREMTFEEIAGVKEAFIEAAIRARTAGFDGVELHGAHGYLLSQFASPVSNRRSDKYGQGISGRLILACEIIAGIRQTINDDSFIIGYRMGCNEPTVSCGVEIAKILDTAGIDIIHVSSGIGGNKGNPHNLETISVNNQQISEDPPPDFPFSKLVYYSSVIKRSGVRPPVIAVGGIKTPEAAISIIERGYSDFTAIGRGLLTDPKWALKVMKEITPDPCLDCPTCKWFKNSIYCPGRKY